MKNFKKSSEIPVEDLAPGLSRQILGHDTQLMLVRVYFEKGVVAPGHQHPHQQITFVEQGVFEVEIDNQKQVLRQGDSFIVPANVVHGVTCLKKGVLIDAFSPRRDDFLKSKD